MFGKPQQPATTVAPKAPTIDQAANEEEFSRKVARRKGGLANMYAPQGGAAPSVAVRAALGNSAGA